ILPRGRATARAGRIRPKTMSPGSLTTPKLRPVSTMTLSTTLVKRPKNAFQSPGTHHRTGYSSVVALAICPPYARVYRVVARASRKRWESDTQPNIPPCALIMASAATWNSGKYEATDAAMLQDAVEVRGEEGALARLVHYRLTGLRIELLHEVVALLAADENAPHRTRITDARGETAARLLGGRAVGQIGAMALPRVDDQEPALAGGPEDALGGRHGAAQKRDVVAERLAESARIHEVALEVDHHEGGGLRIELVLVGLRVDQGHGTILLEARTSPRCVTICSMGSGRIDQDREGGKQIAAGDASGREACGENPSISGQGEDITPGCPSGCPLIGHPAWLRGTPGERWAGRPRPQARQDPRARGSHSPSPRGVRGRASRSPRQSGSVAVELGRAASVPRDQSRGWPARLRHHDARLHLGARIREGGLAPRPDPRGIARGAVRALSLGRRSGNLSRADLGPAVVHERRASLLPRRPPRPSWLLTARDLRRDAGADPGHPGRRGQSSARGISLARQAVRRPRGECSRGTLGRRHESARRRRSPLPRPRTGGAGVEVSPHAHRHGSEPGVGHRGGRGEHAPAFRQR